MQSNKGTIIPEAITRYQAAHDCRDVDTALRQFTLDATIEDDGRIYEGIEGVELFLRKAGSEYTYTRTLVAATEVLPNRWRITNHLAGNFPGGHVNLSYEFRLESGLIAHLTISP